MLSMTLFMKAIAVTVIVELEIISKYILLLFANRYNSSALTSQNQYLIA